MCMQRMCRATHCARNALCIHTVRGLPYAHTTCRACSVHTLCSECRVHVPCAVNALCSVLPGTHAPPLRRAPCAPCASCKVCMWNQPATSPASRSSAPPSLGTMCGNRVSNACSAQQLHEAITKHLFDANACSVSPPSPLSFAGVTRQAIAIRQNDS